IHDLKTGGSEALQKFGRFADTTVLFELANKEDIQGFGLSVPGIYCMVDRDTEEVLAIVGTNNIAQSISFSEKALNKGRINADKSDKHLDKKYGRRSAVYKRFRDLAKHRIKYEVVSLEDPHTITGRAVVLQLIK